MKAIFASKMYKSSPRKDKIKAALSDPINVELVQQLREYLDDEYIDEKYLEPEDTESLESSQPAEGTDEETKDESSGESLRPRSHSNEGSASNSDEFEETSSTFEEGVSDEGSEDIDVEESDDAEGSPIIAVDDTATLKDTIDEQSVLDMLNADENSFGVRRVQQVQNELWVYYLDTTNLNTVMESVISQLNSKYPELSFSRLARTSNAVVFTIEN